MRVWVTRDKGMRVVELWKERPHFDEPGGGWFVVSNSGRRWLGALTVTAARRLGITVLIGGPTSMVEMELQEPCFKEAKK